jgi:peptidyl-prolyl cis-trans isomerase C
MLEWAMNKKRLFTLLGAVILSLACAQPDPVVAKVGGTNLLKSHFDFQWELFVRDALQRQGQPYNDETIVQFADLRPRYLERLARDQAVTNAAIGAGFEATPDEIESAMTEVQGQFENEEAFGKALIDAGIPDIGTYRQLAYEAITYNNYIKYLTEKISISDSALLAQYTLNKSQYASPKTFCSSHILLKTEGEATDVIGKLGGGADFAELAKQYSEDPGSKENGGDLGCEPSGSFVEPFEVAMQGLQIGQTTTAPVQTQFGFHVIRLTKVNNGGFTPFESVKEQLAEGVKNAAVNKLIEWLVARAKIELFPDNLK